MVDSELSFNKIVSEVKEIVDLALLNPKNYDPWKMSHVTKYSGSDDIFAIPFDADSHILQIIQYVRTKSKKWDSVLSDDYISQELLRLVYEIKIEIKQIKYSQIGKTVKDWIKKLETMPRINFRFILPVNNVEYRQDYDLGSVKLQKITLETLRAIVPFNDTENLEHFSSDNTFKQITECNQTDVFAIIEVQTKDAEQGIELANTRLNKLIHAMRLFNPGSWITERIGYFPQTGYHTIIVNLDDGTFEDPYSNLHLTAHILPKKEYWDDVDDYWTQLTSFLYHESPNELQTLILNGLFWYGEAGKETETNLSKFLKYIHGLETLVIFDKEFGKRDRFAERLTTIFNKKDSDNFEKSKKLLKKYYDLRSITIHAGQFNVDDEDVGTTHSLLRSLIFKYIELSKKYDNVKDMFANEFSIDITTKSSKTKSSLMTKLSSLFSRKIANNHD